MKNWVLITLLSILSSPAFANPLNYRGVKVGGDANFDACGGSGITTATTAMYVADGSGHWKFVVVPANTRVFFCDSQDEYTGVVIHDKNSDCKVSSPISREIEYTGPCQSGWIKNIFLELLAG